MKKLDIFSLKSIFNFFFIYLACPAGKRGIMFLNEAILGKEKHIDRDDSSLVKAPAGFDCVVAKGWTEPGKSYFPFLFP